jgi:blue copper oxidase
LIESEPGSAAKGWKDMLYIDNDERVRFLARLLDKGIFVHHCHILEHEDDGMVGRFKHE